MGRVWVRGEWSECGNRLQRLQHRNLLIGKHSASGNLQKEELLETFIMVSFWSNSTAESSVRLSHVVLPLQRAQVWQCITTTFGLRCDVVNFPTVDWRAVSVFAECHPGTTLVFTILGTVVTWYGLSFVPNLKNKIIFHFFNWILSASFEQGFKFEDSFLL